MRIFKIFLLVIISIVLVVCGWVYLVGMSAERTAFSAVYYRNLVEEVDLTSTLHQELEKTLPEMMLEGMAGDMEEEAEIDEVMHERIGMITGALMQAFDASWLDEQLLLVTDDVLALVSGEQDSLYAAIDMQDNKERFREELAARLESLTEEQREEMDMPPGEAEQMAEQIVADMDFPDRLELGELILSEGMSGEMEAALSTVQRSRSFFRFAPYVLFALLLLFCCLLAGIAGGLKWFGAAALFFSGTFIVGLQVARAAFLDTLIANIVEEAPFSADLLLPAAEFTINRASTVPLVCAALALLFLIAGFVLPKVRPGVGS